MSCNCQSTNTNVQSRWKCQNHNEISPKTESLAHRNGNDSLAIYPSNAFFLGHIEKQLNHIDN